MKKRYFLYFILYFTVCASCEEVNPAKPIREGVLRTWKVNEVKISLGDVDLTTVYKLGDPNFIVNYESYRLTFFDDNTYYKIDEYNVDWEGIWEFASNDTKILFDKGIDISDIALVLDYGSTDLVLQFEEENQKLGNIIREFYFIPADD